MALISCSECGAQISDTAANCIKCGAPIVKKEFFNCFECNAELEKGTKICSNCGAEQELKEQPQDTPLTNTNNNGSAVKKKSGLKKNIIIVVVIALIGAVGGIFWQLAKNKGRMDVYKEQQIQQQREQAEAERQQKINEFKNELADLKAKLQMAYNDLQKINQFQIGRTRNQKESQLSNQHKYIDQIKERIDAVNNQLSILE